MFGPDNQTLRQGSVSDSWNEMGNTFLAALLILNVQQSGRRDRRARQTAECAASANQPRSEPDKVPEAFISSFIMIPLMPSGK